MLAATSAVVDTAPAVLAAVAAASAAAVHRCPRVRTSGPRVVVRLSEPSGPPTATCTLLQLPMANGNGVSCLINAFLSQLPFQPCLAPFSLPPYSLSHASSDYFCCLPCLLLPPAQSPLNPGLSRTVYSRLCGYNCLLQVVSV